MKIEAVIGGKSSRERFWKNSSQCRGIWLQVKQVMASFCCYDNFDVIVTLMLPNFHLYLIQLWPVFPRWHLVIAILGFHITSPKFKLRNYRFFWVSTFMWNYSTLKPLYKKISIQKGSSFNFAIHDALISRLLCDGAFSRWPGKLLCGFKTLPFWEIGNKYYFNLYEFLTAKNSRISRKTQKLDVSVGFRRPYLCPWRGHNEHGVSIQSFINLGETFFRISCIWTIA